MATDFNITGAADFVNADPTALLADVILEGMGTKDHYSFETGVKYQTKIPYVSDYSVDIQTGTVSGYLAGSGQTTILDVTLANVPLHIREHYTKETIDKKVLGLLEPGTNPEDLPIRDLITDLKGKALHLGNEVKLWQETTDFDGVVEQVATGAVYADEYISFAASSDAEILANVNSFKDALALNLDKFITADSILSMSPAQFQSYAAAVHNLNGAISTLTIGADGKPVQEMMVPGTSIKAVAEIGMTGIDNLVLTIPENIIVAYDLVDEAESLEMLYNPFAKWYELTAQYKLGVKVVDVANVITSAIPSA